MLAKLQQLECAQGFVHLMYNLLELLGKTMEFMLPSGSAVCGNGQRLLPVRALNPLMWKREYRGRWILWDLSCTGRTRHLNPARHPSPVESVLGLNL
jgi:hypothetical protein